MDVNSDDTYGVDTSHLIENSYEFTENQSIPVYADNPTYPCSNCGRCFNVDSLRKHQPVCQRSSQKQPRKVFDAGKQRATDSDVPYKATKDTTQFYNVGVKPKSDKQKKKSNRWREDHHELVRTIRQARQVNRPAENDSGSVPRKAPAQQISSDYIQCEFCQRNFNKYSAERHIPFCETQFKRKQMQYSNHVRSEHVHQQQQQSNSAPSTLVFKLPQRFSRTNGEKAYKRPPFHPKIFKRTTSTEATKDAMPPKYAFVRMSKTRSAAENYLPGKMIRPSRLIHNESLNAMAGGARSQQKMNASPKLPHRMLGMKRQSPSPARRQTQIDQSTQQRHVKEMVAFTAAKHCHECGKAFPVEWAKFCCECGEKRFGLE